LHLITSTYSVWFGSYLLLAILLPFAFAFRLWPGKDSAAAVISLRAVVFAALLCGAIIGRLLMYAVGTTLPPF
jgi:hypothetical protein